MWMVGELLLPASKRQERRKPFGFAQDGACIDPHGYDAGNPSVNSGDQG